jgi:hypothetical protein
MRSVSTILFASGMLWAGWASAQTQAGPVPSGLPGATLEDAGQASGFGQFLCGLPGSQIDAFRQKVDSLTSGGSHSAAFLAGETSARKLIDKVRQGDADNGDTRELRDSSCNEATSLIARTIALP